MSRHSASRQDKSFDERLNMRKPLPTVADLHEQGKSMRESVPRELHGQWKPDGQREDVLSIITRRNAGRQKRLIPLRMERMAASPFAFLRGAAAVMAYDELFSPSYTRVVNVRTEARTLQMETFKSCILNFSWPSKVMTQ